MNPKPATAGTPKTSREYTVIKWKHYEQNTLRGFFSVLLPSGMIIHDFMYHKKGEDRWVNAPSRPKDAIIGSDNRFPPLIEIPSQEKKKQFNDELLDALDRYFAVMETSL